ncbi:DUF11 domain-containing protein [Curtobacterium sp. Csp1]|uniref:DUF7927 domain-containing protein n=1 Tax=Curtobacterium sp. Csp1 TaxID=2495429 RepID=UPI00159778DD|nr:DUF11 domain-containing protein [Curtobacterium sp. Csp1]QKS18851.1 DUF11 domain-containing protein [Curtobacterium sp. Csp1]
MLYSEGFQNNGPTPELLTRYSSPSGQQYTADNDWLINCNGIVLQYNSPDSAANSQPVSGCANRNSNALTPYSYLRQEAWAIGKFRGVDPTTNNVVSAYTQNLDNSQLQPNEIEFKTVQPIALPQASGRFVSFSVDGAALNCYASGPQYNFYLVQSDGTEVKAGNTINMCNSGTTITAPAVGTVGPQDVHVGTYTSNAAIKVTGNTVGVILRNANGSGYGNDASFDNIQILDATPQMDKSFSPAVQRLGDTSTLTFTVTNTSELGAKQGWGFTDNLPNGLVLANGNVGGTCNAATSVQAGGTTITTTNGNLAVGEKSCTITVQVTSTQAGTYQNCPNTNVTTTSLNQPACAAIEFTGPTYTVSKTADKTTAKQGDTVTYTVTVKNTGQVPYSAARPATFTDDLSKVLDDATYNGDATNGATVSGTTLSWSGPLAVGETKTITYSVKVNNPDQGDHELTNAVTPDSSNGGSCDPTLTCTTTTPVQSYTIEKSVDRSKVVPGQKVTYTVTVKNTGKVNYTASNPAAFTDDLSKVTDDATYNGDATNGATVSGNTLSWSGPLAVGATQTITYSFTVNDPDTGDQQLTNSVVPNDPTACVGKCTTTVPNAGYTVQKTVDKQKALPGDKVTYTVTVKNTGKAAYTAQDPASFTDDLSKVTDDATYNKDATNGATVSGNTLSWSGALAVGATQTITYSFTVNDPDTGDHQLDNAVTPTAPGGECAQSDGCATSTPVQSYTTQKTVNKTTVNQGDKVVYTVTVTNTGKVAYTAQDPATFTDDLSKVTDDATYNGDASNGATVSGSTLSWSGPLSVGAKETITYSFTVNTPDTGDKVLTNAVTPTGPGGDCAQADGCTTQSKVASFITSKAADKATANQGDTVTYTVTVKNTGQVAYTDQNPASFTDDLSKVLDDATYNGDASNGATVSGTTLSWKGALGVGDTTTITYSVKVNTPDTGDHKLNNVVTPGTGGDCAQADGCTTETPVAAYTVTKTVDATEVVPGNKVTYTVTVENTGAVAYTAANPAAFTDDLSKVTDDATYNGDATNGATVTGNTLNWDGPLAVGAKETITYSFTVNNPDTGDHKLINQVVPKDPTACVGKCSTQVPAGSYTTSKTASEATAKEGDTVTYTITVKNTGQVNYTTQTPASFTDDLSKVTDDATYNGDAKVSYSEGSTGNNPTVSGNTMSWSGPLKIGETATITYSVKVNTPDTGDKVLTNAVVPSGPGGDCVTPGGCTVNTPVGSFTVAKQTDKTTAKPGEVVHYTVTVTNTGAFSYTEAKPASFTDDLSKVTDDATYNGDASSGATVEGNTLSWSGPLGKGQTITVTYSFTVNNPDTGDQKLVNVVDPGAGGGCATQGGCTTSTTVTPTPPTPQGPTVATGGTAITGLGVWPMVGAAGSAIAVLLALLTMTVINRRRNGDSA